MRTQLALALCATGLTGFATAQVTQYNGPSTNLTTALDFDTPFVASGPIASNAPEFVAAGITAVNIIGTPAPAGDTLTGASNVMGQGLISQNGVLAVGGAGDPLDSTGAGGGWEVVLANPVDEFQVLFIDQVNMNYDIELLNGATSLGIGSFNYSGGFPNPPHFWRGPSQFDTVRITFPQSVGVGLDEFAFGNGPPPMPPANDECAMATAAAFGANAYSSLNATASTQLTSCATSGADVWFTYTALTANDLRIETCGSGYDTVIEVYRGTCGALSTVGCNDDACGTSSRVDVPGVNVGDVLTIQVAGFGGAQGAGTLTISDAPPPPPANCARTLFASNNGGNVGGGVYFDMIVTQNVSFSGMLTNTSTTAGLPVGLAVYTTPGTYAGNETNMAVWTLVAEDDSTGVSAGDDGETAITFVAPFTLAPGTYGIAIIGVNPTTGDMLDHDYTNGTGGNQNYMSADGVITLDLGTASNVGFAAPLFSPRVWNGEFCHTASSPGTNYCMANPNSTGGTGMMSATGSSSVNNNDLTLVASGLPNNAFSFFITSQTQGFVANPNGSAGNLCVLGSIGRYVGTGQIQNSGNNGMVSLTIDNTMHPQPTGFVMVMATETWNFQLWHRDSSPTGPTSNFTDGLEVLFSN